MQPVGGQRIAYAIRMISIQDPQNVHEFNTFIAAQKFAGKNGKVLHHSTVKRCVEQGKEAYGYRWSMVYPPPPENEDRIENVEETYVFTFRECVEQIFEGGRVRVTTENPRRVSVFDLIRVVTGDVNPRGVYQRVCAEHEDVRKTDIFMFPGQGQRETPVVAAADIMKWVLLLPGKRARLFRKNAADMLVRFLAGDQTLHEEIDQQAALQAALPDQHPMRIFSEAVYANPKSRKYVMKSPRMQGKLIHEFYNKMVVYLLEFKCNDKTYVKIGWSDDLRQRMDNHFTEYVNFELHTVIQVDKAPRLEKTFNDRYALYNEQVTINGKTKTELFSGISIEQAEEFLVELFHEIRLDVADDRQVELEKMKMEHERWKMEHELKNKQIEIEFEMKKLDMEMKRLS